MQVTNVIKTLFGKMILPLIDDKTLKPGVSALVCCKDEEYNIPLALKSLIGLVDQIICIDHNSTDSTFEKMVSFQNEYNKYVDIMVVKYKGRLLKDARNYGLTFVKHKWLLNMGGDFIFLNEEDYVRNFFNSLKINNSFSAFQLYLVNLFGDLRHTYKNGDIYGLGEYYIVRKIKYVFFKESGKFDYLFFPKFYLRKKIDKPFFFHLSGLKSDNRLLHRNCYFEWREVSNHLKKIGNVNSPYHDFEFFQLYWKNYLFNTVDEKLLKYRFQRQLCSLECQLYDEEKYFKYPQIIKEILKNNCERFVVKYENELPYIRIDIEDNEMANFSPSGEEKEWNVEDFKEKYYTKKYLEIAKNNNYGKK